MAPMQMGLPPPPRRPGWPARLHDLVAERLARPFAWGSNDCATFAADVALALHGQDTLASLRNAARPRANARWGTRQARRAGGPAVLEQCGLVPVAPALARVGDIVLVQQPRPALPAAGDRRRAPRPALALCNGEVALAVGPQGLEMVPMTQALAAWRV